jgi:hypothetical protein
MYKKQKGLATDNEKLTRIYTIENKLVSMSSVARVRGKKGVKIMKATALTY